MGILDFDDENQQICKGTIEKGVIDAFVTMEEITIQRNPCNNPEIDSGVRLVVLTQTKSCLLVFSPSDLEIIKKNLKLLAPTAYIIFSSVIYKKANLFKWASQFLILISSGHLMRFQNTDLNELCEVYNFSRVKPQDVTISLNVVTMDKSDPHASQISITIPEKTLLFSVSTSEDSNLPQIWESLLQFISSGNIKSNNILLSCTSISFLTPLIKTLEDQSYCRNNFTRQSIRMGIPYNLRNEVWLGYTNTYKIHNNPLDKPSYCDKEIIQPKLRSLIKQCVEDYSIPVNSEHEERCALIFQSYCENHPLVKQNSEMISILLYFVHTLSDDESYWLFDTLIHSVLPLWMKRYLDQYEILFHLECYTIETIIAESIPDIYSSLLNIKFDIKPILMKWFSGAFVGLPMDTLYYVWDLLFSEGYLVFIRLVISLIIYHSKTLQLMSLLNDVQGYFEIILVKTDDIEQLRDIMFGDSRLNMLTEEYVDMCRSRQWADLTVELNIACDEENNKMKAIELVNSSCTKVSDKMKSMKNKLISLKNHLSSSDTINQTFNDILDMSNDLLKSIETSYILINECKTQLTRRDKALQILTSIAVQKRNETATKESEAADFSLTALAEPSNPVSLYLSLNSIAWRLVYNCTSSIQLATQQVFGQASWGNSQPFLKISHEKMFKIEVDPTAFFTEVAIALYQCAEIILDSCTEMIKIYLPDNRDNKKHQIVDLLLGGKKDKFALKIAELRTNSYYHDESEIQEALHDLSQDVLWLRE